VKPACAALAALPATAPDFDVVIDSRVEFSRNLAGHRFAERMDASERSFVAETLMAAARSAGLDGIRVGELDARARREASDRGLFPVGFTVDPGNLFACSSRDPVWVVANERDHATIRAELAGSPLESCLSLAVSCDTALGSALEWAFDRDFGFIACDVARCGSGMTASSRLHLPALTLSALADRALRQAMEAGFSVSGGYSLETQAAGSVFGLSLPPAAEEKAGISRLSRAVELLARYERRAREELLERDPAVILDFVGRSFGKARWSFTLGYDEACEIVSGLRLGLAVGMLKGLSMGEATGLWDALKRAERGARGLDGQAERETEARARVLRAAARRLSCDEEYADV